MLFVIEGPDGAGKTTLVQRLSKRLHAQGRGCVLVNPKGAPRRPALEEYARDLSFYTPGGDVDLVLDRSWRSEEVYGPAWRGVGLPPGTLDYLEAWAAARGAVFLRLDAPDDDLVRRVTARGDDLVTDPAELLRLAADYRGLELPWTVEYDAPAPLPDEQLSVLVSLAREKAARGGRVGAASYVGPLRPTVLLLADRRSTRALTLGYTSALPPYPGSAAHQVLWPALAQRQQQYGVLNANEDDVAVAVRALAPRCIVALGVEALAAAERAGVTVHGSAPHPQYVKRFFYSRRGEYAACLSAAVDGAHALGHFGPTDPSRRETQ